MLRNEKLTGCDGPWEPEEARGSGVPSHPELHSGALSPKKAHNQSQFFHSYFLELNNNPEIPSVSFYVGAWFRHILDYSQAAQLLC